MKHEGPLTVIVLTKAGKDIVIRCHVDGALEPVSEQDGVDQHPADEHRGYRQQHQGHPNHRRRFMQMAAGMLVHALLAVKDDEIQAEAVEGGNQDTDGQHYPGVTGTAHMREAHRLDDGVLREKAGKARKTNQRQGPDQEGDPGIGHVLADTAHVADVLVVVHGNDDRARGQKKQRLKKGVGH